MKDFLKNLGLLPISKERRSIEDLLITSNSIFENDSFIVELEERINPRLESFHGKGIVYIPQKFKEIEPIYLKLKEKLGEIQYPKFVTCHEFGHAAQVACVHNNLPIHIKGSSSEGDINYLFNGSIVPNKISNFIKELFKEGFADCYGGLCLFKENGDIKVFKRVSQVRKERYDEFKEKEGKHFLHPNFNINAAANMGLSR